jgi:hypothetical protein
MTSPDEEVAKVQPCGEPLRAEVVVVEFNDFAVGYAETPIGAGGPIRGIGKKIEDAFAGAGGTAGAGIDGFVIGIMAAWRAFMRSAERSGKIFARAAAWIDVTAFVEPAPGSEIGVEAGALGVGSAWAAGVGPFIPVHTEPVKIFEGRRGVFGAASVGVEILHAHDQDAARFSGALPCSMEGTGMADVEEAGGRWGEAAAIAGTGIHSGPV